MIPLSHDSFALRTDTHLVVFHQPRRRRLSEGAQALAAAVLVLAVIAVPVATALLRDAW